MPTMLLPPGSRIGPYEVVAPIGAGGMSEVYRARDHRLDRDVALKILHPELAGQTEAVARFEKEAKAVAALSHPNIVAIYDYGHADGVSYLAMELLDGETLRAEVNGPMAWRRAATIVATVADALRTAHAQGIVHRDLKPENIVMTRSRALKVLDFGLARAFAQPAEAAAETLTTPGTVMGTAGYMSPEQVRGEPAGPASDLFSLGCLFYELLSGRSPFRRPSPAESMAAILRDDPPDLRSLGQEIPEGIVRVVEHCLEKNPETRFQSAADFAFALSAAINGSGPHARIAAAPRRRRSAVILAVLLIALVGAIVASRRSATSPAPPPARSLAVLPFQATPPLAYVSEGLTEGIINDLSPVGGFKVLSRNTVFSYKARSNDPRAIGKELGVDALVTGRVVQQPQSLVVSVELIDAREGNQIWGERYERPLSEVPQIERELSRQISAKLQLRLTGADQSRMNRRASVDPNAYRLYLQGRYEWNKRTPEGLRKGVEFFRRSIDIDASYAPAHAGIADSYLLLGGNYEILPPKEAMPLARKAAARALELDPALAEPHATLGVIAHEFDWDWPRAEESFRRAIALNPNSPVAHQWYGQALLYRGRPEEGLRELQRAEELDPLSLVTRSDLAQAFWITRQYDAAVAQAERLIELEPQFWLGHFFLGMACIGRNDLTRATAALEQAVQLGGSPAAIGSLGYAYARSGRRKEALRLRDELREASRGRYISPAPFLTIALGLGDFDAVFAELGRAIDERAALVAVMNVVPIADPLRADPRYAEYARRVGLP
jgi:serine/threonine protein kinase/tetratricopeptide (TPR) repeat protein